MSPYDDSATRQRNTKQRHAVAALLADINDFRTAQELHGLLGELDVMRLPSGEQLFRRCSRTHHHHLVCRSCARTVEVAGPTVESWADRIAGEHGFVDISHTVEIFGTCPTCASV
jgi:Fur family ferric uptake transcriptional regulator